MKNGKRCTMILLAGGKGSRMGAATPKQFLEIKGKPMIWYSLTAVEQSSVIDDCILVCGKDDIPYMRDQILGKNDFSKVLAIAPGGSERYDSVMNGIKMLSELAESCDAGLGKRDYIFIHDGARPFLNEEILERCLEGVMEHRAVVAGVPSKDTIKLTNDEGEIYATPERKDVWIAQTPQVFEAELITEAFASLEKTKLLAEESGYTFDTPEGLAASREKIAAVTSLKRITDDASVVEMFTDVRVSMVMGDYRNIKVTTPEDLLIMECFLC